MLSDKQLLELYPNASDDNVSSFMKNGEALFDEFGLNENSNRLYFFLAQIGHESGGLRITEEGLYYSKPQRLMTVWPSRFKDLESATPFARNPEKLANNVYSNRMGNGDTDSGDGWRYRGRGYIQITGRDGYRKVGQNADLELEQNPDWAFDPEQALHVACAFWRLKKLNVLCDTGDYVKVTRRINGGTNGMADRRAWLDKVHRVMGGEAETILLGIDVIISVQKALQRAGFPEIGAADGIIGKRTLSAISRYRLKKGLPIGQVDDALLQSLGIDTE